MIRSLICVVERSDLFAGKDGLPLQAQLLHHRRVNNAQTAVQKPPIWGYIVVRLGPRISGREPVKQQQVEGPTGKVHWQKDANRHLPLVQGEGGPLNDTGDFSATRDLSSGSRHER